MRYQKILLLNPPYTGTRVNVVFCAGLGYIAEILKISDFEYEVLDMSLGYNYKDLKKRIDSFKPDLIGISMMTYMYKETYSLTRYIKKDYPEIDIAVGGPHVSLFREKILQDSPHIDYGIVLEGEETIIKLCKGEPLCSIKGLIFRDKNFIVYNGDRPFIKNLDEIPFPRYEKFELDKSFNKEINALPIVSSRGCPFECIYCPVKSSIGEIFRGRSPENIIVELTYWYKRGYRRFSFADDNFTLIKERVYHLCELIKESDLKGLKLSCDNGIRADMVDRDLLKFMKEAGFFRIAIGVEAGNNKILVNLKKKENIERIKKTIEDACSLEYEVDLFFLVGSPGETLQDLQDSFKIALDYPIGIAYFYNVIPFPHTELFSWIQKNGRFIKSPEDYLNNYPILDNDPVFETSDMSKEERKKALKYAFGITRKTMRRSWIKRMERCGLLGKILAIVYSNRLIQDKLLRNVKFKKFTIRIGAVVLKCLIKLYRKFKPLPPRIYFCYNQSIHQIYHSLFIAIEFSNLGNNYEVAVLSTSKEASDIIEEELSAIPNRVKFIKIWHLGYNRADFNVNWFVFFCRLRMRRPKAVIVTDYFDSAFRQLLLETFWIYAAHGIVNREFSFHPHIKDYDLVILPGNRDLKEVEKAIGPLANAVVLGYSKLDYFKYHDLKPLNLFKGQRPVLLYNPHFEKELSSFFKAGQDLLEALASSGKYNVIFMPHPDLARKYPRLIDKAYSLPAITVAARPKINLDYMAVSDLYITDVSSSVYEWLYFNKPVLFFNPKGRDWKKTGYYPAWILGRVVQTIPDMLKAIEESLKNPAEFQNARRDMFNCVFVNTDKNASRIIAECIYDKLKLK